MKELIQLLEAAVLKRNPALATRLRSGSSPEQIRKDLKRGGVTGAIEPLIAMYSWRDGTNLQGELDTGYALGFTPPTVHRLADWQIELMAQFGKRIETQQVSYHFMASRLAILHFKGYAS